MYHHHSQQQGSQPFANGPRPPHHRPPPNEHQSHPTSGMLPSTGFQFPRPTQLPDELESALAIHTVRDMDHRLIDIMNQSNQHETQSSGSRVSQHGNYGSNPRGLTSEDPQGIEWSSYQPPTKLFANPPPTGTHQPQRHQAPLQQPQSSHTVSNIPRWAGDSSSPQARHPRGSGADGQGLYTPESAGSILASFGLSNEDLEVLSHYPDDQLTPDTLPFILRDIQISKSGKKTVGMSSAPPFPRTDRPLPSRSPPLTRPLSPNVPSLLTVTQTAGKVIDYGHASRATEETTATDTFKRELLSSERTVKMYPSSSSSSVPKKDIIERRQVRLEHTDSSKYGDQDYRRAGNDHRKSNRSPGREFPLQTKSRYEDIDYRTTGPKFRSSSETTSEASSRRLPSSSYKKMPTPTMISDFCAMPPKVYPHTCSLCHIECDQEKDWVDHVNTVNHTAACRDLRNKYIDWKPDLPSRSGRYGSRALWDPKDQPRSSSGSRSLSRTPSPPRGRRISGPHPHRVQGKPYSPHPHPGHHPYTGSSHRVMKRPREDSPKFPSASSRHSTSSKHGPPHASTKTGKPPKPVAKTTKTANTKAADASSKPTILKKKKKVVSQSSQDSKAANRLVYLTGIPKDATEQEVTDLVGSFGKINNVILMPCSEEESKNGEGQKASVCMVKAEDAQSLAASTNLSIRDQQITAVITQKPLAEKPATAKTSISSPGVEKPAAVENSSKETIKPAPQNETEAEADQKPDQKADQKADQKPDQKPEQKPDQKASNEKSSVLITGLPESDWSESDIVSLVEPFGTPCEVITAKQIGKALVLMPDTEVAQEMVKLNTLTPMQLKDCELSMTQLEQSVGLNTPVALYNLLMVSAEQSESSAPVGWSSLLLISNIPSTLSGPSEVEKLVRRFGTVIKTLVVNSMLICEMATPAMALSVYKRFQTFPCIIHNNPLYFSRKADPKTSTASKVAIASPERRKETSAATDKSIQPAPSADKEASEHPPEEVKKADNGKDEPVKSAEESVGAVAASDENGSKDDDIKKDEPVTVSSAAPDAQPEAELEMKTTETPTVEAGTVTEAVEEEKSSGEPKAENDKPSADEEAKPCISDSKEASPEKPQEELPKLTQEMVNTLLVECRTQSSSGAASTNGDKEETQTETDHGKKVPEKTKVTAKNHAEQEAKKQERERKEREARKEKEARERERKERERKAWEKERAKREKEREERTRRERERRDQERKEWERKDRARRERKRPHGEDVSRSSGRSEAKSSRRDESHSEAENEMEMNCDDFPFNLSDFVTVDEVGDVADLPCQPSSPETMEHATSMQVDAASDAASEDAAQVTTEATMSETTSTQVQSEPTPQSEVLATAERSDGVMSSDLTPGSQTSPSDSSQSQTQVPVEVPGPSETESAEAATPSSTTLVEPIATPAPADCSEQAEKNKQQEEEQKEMEEKQREEEKRLEEEKKREEEEKQKAEARLEEEKRLEEERHKEEEEKRLEEEKQKVEEEKRLEEEKRKEEEEKRLEEKREEEEKRLEEEKRMKQEKQKEEQEVKEEVADAPVKDTENLKKCEDQTNKEKGESVKGETPMSTGNSLPPYNPSNPVGMEFLVPKTGFFCKPCNRFFTGVKEAEISHCKTLKHYDNLQKFLQTMKTPSSKPSGC